MRTELTSSEDLQFHEALKYFQNTCEKKQKHGTFLSVKDLTMSQPEYTL